MKKAARYGVKRTAIGPRGSPRRSATAAACRPAASPTRSSGSFLSLATYLPTQPLAMAFGTAMEHTAHVVAMVPEHAVLTAASKPSSVTERSHPAEFKEVMAPTDATRSARRVPYETTEPPAASKPTAMVWTGLVDATKPLAPIDFNPEVVPTTTPIRDLRSNWYLGLGRVRLIREHTLHVLQVDRRHVRARLNEALQDIGLPPLSAAPTTTLGAANEALDVEKISKISSLVLQTRLSPAATVRLVRGETVSDPRPNKALCPRRLAELYADYEHQSLLVSMATHGFPVPMVTRVAPNTAPPGNHKSASTHPVTVLRKLREGQDKDEYLLLSAEVYHMWQSQSHPVHISPLGLVAQKDKSLDDDGRIIHDLSYPDGESVNDFSDKTAFPWVQWRRFADIAARITALHTRFSGIVPSRGLVCDVHGAFRHMRSTVAHSSWFGLWTPIDDVWGLDLAGPFGWTGYPPYYVAFGRGISYLVQPRVAPDFEPGTHQRRHPVLVLGMDG